MITATSLLNQKIDDHPRHLAQLKLKIDSLNQKKQSLCLESRYEFQKLNNAKVNFAPIKRSYIKSYR